MAIMEETLAEIKAEDQFIRTLILLGSTVLILGLLTVAMVITLMVSLNFNIMTWLE